jgi:beta-phosphoglucomutase
MSRRSTTPPAASDLAVIFDVDGVLVDSADAHRRSWEALAREIGAPLEPGWFPGTFGMTSRDIIARLWPAQAASAERVARIDERKEALYRELVRDAVPIMDGAVELIDALHAAGVRLAVGSSGPPENVALALRGLDRGDSFAASVTGRDVTRGKPDPQVFLLAARRLGLAPACCAVIEDARVGVQAALAGGMAVVGFAASDQAAAALAGADLVVPSLRDLGPGVIRALIEGRGSAVEEPPGAV